MKVVQVGAIGISKALDHHLLKPLAPLVAIGRVQNHGHNVLKGLLPLAVKQVLVVAESACFTKANAIVMAIHNDSGVQVGGFQFQVLAKLRDVLAALLFPLLGLLNTLRH
ncbi:hypothetical protein D3C78_1474830 [compost metagenome]